MAERLTGEESSEGLVGGEMDLLLEVLHAKVSGADSFHSELEAGSNHLPTDGEVSAEQALVEGVRGETFSVKSFDEVF